MGINIAGGADIAVPQPLLNFLQAHAVGVKQACAAMAQVVEADALHVVRREELREMLAQKVGADAPAHRVHMYSLKSLAISSTRLRSTPRW